MTCEPTRHGHHKVRREGRVYTFPAVSGRREKAVYIPKIRRKLLLDEEHGVNDEEFWGKREPGQAGGRKRDEQ